jgi:hypothetical protein
MNFTAEMEIARLDIGLDRFNGQFTAKITRGPGIAKDQITNLSSTGSSEKQVKLEVVGGAGGPR